MMISGAVMHSLRCGRGLLRLQQSIAMASSASSSATVRKVISTPNAPGAVGPYSQAVQVGNTLYISGSIGFDPKNGNFVEGGVQGQAHQSLKNIGAILKAAGIGYGNVVKTTVLLKDMNDFVTVNGIYQEYFKEPYPARAAYEVARLPKDALIEIEAIAVVGEIKDA